MQNHPFKEFMLAAIEEARKAVATSQYPLGAVIIQDGVIISRAHTTVHESNDPTAHAEINAIRQAADILKSRYLPGCWLYTTQEPCPMCASAAIWAKMEGIVFGASKENAMEFWREHKHSHLTWRQIDISAKDVLKEGDPRLSLVESFMAEECKELIWLSAKN